MYFVLTTIFIHAAKIIFLMFLYQVSLSKHIFQAVEKVFFFFFF